MRKSQIQNKSDLMETDRHEECFMYMIKTGARLVYSIPPIAMRYFEIGQVLYANSKRGTSFYFLNDYTPPASANKAIFLSRKTKAPQ